MWQTLVNSQAFIPGLFTLIGALIGFGGTFLTQRQQHKRELLTYRRTLRSAKAERLRAAAKLMIRTAWATRQLVAQDETARLPGYSEEDRNRYFARLERMDADQEEARMVVAVDMDQREVVNLAHAMSRVYRDYHAYRAAIVRGAKPEHTIESLRERSEECLIALIAAIQAVLAEYDEPEPPRRLWYRLWERLRIGAARVRGIAGRLRRTKVDAITLGPGAEQREGTSGHPSAGPGDDDGGKREGDR